MLKATKVRLYPTIEQQAFLNAQFGAVRFAYNQALRIKTHFYKKKAVSLHPIKDIKPLLSVAKRSRKYAWLSQYDSMALQQAVINLNVAFSNFFDKKLRARYPQFKRRHGSQSSYHCTSIKITNNSIKIPKLKTAIKAKMHRIVDGQLKSITVSRSATGKYFASILVDTGEPLPAKPTHIDSNKLFAFDLGLTSFLTDSNGHKEANPRFLKNAYRNLRRKQKALSRCQKGSANRAKARRKLAKAHELVVNKRNYFQHELSKKIADESQAVVFEKLNITGMVKNRRLARSIADASWGSFVNKVKYKIDWQGKHFTQTSQWLASSKTCHVCKHKVKDMPLSVRQWVCPICNTLHDRDGNSAKVLKIEGAISFKAAGLTVSAL